MFYIYFLITVYISVLSVLIYKKSIYTNSFTQYANIFPSVL
nr:MAG TPA: hypothetical protein [Caudoviricetes sp.]